MKFNKQSAAKPHKYEEGSETIPKGSTLINNTISGSAEPLTLNSEGDDIVQERNFKLFIDKANKKYNSKFDYSKVKYVNAHTLVTIICPEHGEFQQSPTRHLNNKYACPECSRQLKDNTHAAIISRKYAVDRQVTQEEFIDYANKKYNNKFQYIINNWNGLTKSEIDVICPKHGKFTVNARSHIIKHNKYGCALCGVETGAKERTKPYEHVIEQLKNKHNNYYIYPEYNKDNYKNKRSKIDVICPIHGMFVKTVQKHLAGQGCYECKIEELVKNNVLVGGYCEELFNENPELKNKQGILYYLKINDGKYYKIGVSRNNVNDRMKSLKHKAKQYNENIVLETIIINDNYTLYEAYLIEQKILKENLKDRIYKKWSTELFKCDIYENIKHFF